MKEDIGKSRRDEFSSAVKRDLAARSGHHCSNPSCRALTSGPELHGPGSVSLGVAAHITAASAGGPRYDPSLTSEQRSSVENGIWLCTTCAALVDKKEGDYASRQLESWKISSELAARSGLERPGLFASGEVNSYVIASVYRQRTPSRSHEISAWPRPPRGRYYEPVIIKRIGDPSVAKPASESTVVVVLDSKFRSVGSACAFTLVLENRGTAMEKSAYIHFQMEGNYIFKQTVGGIAERRVLPVTNPSERSKASLAGFSVQNLMPGEAMALSIYATRPGRFGCSWCGSSSGTVSTPNVYEVTFGNPALNIDYKENLDEDFLGKHYPFS